MLGLWEFFWTESDWIPAPIELPQAIEKRGSGKGEGPFIKEYHPADYEFWKIREEYLKSHLPQEAKEQKQGYEQVEEVYPELSNLHKVRQEALIRARTAENQEILFESVKKVTELTLQIANLKAQYDEEAILILLLTS